MFGLAKVRAKRTAAVFGSVVALGAAALATPSVARADSVGLGAAGNYAIFALDSFTVTGGSTSINGDVAAGGSYNSSSPAINGTVYLNPGVKPQGSATGGFVTTDLSQAISDAQSAASGFAGLKATQNLGSISSSVTINGNGGQNVIDVSSINMSNGNLTLHGSASDIFIINDSGNFTTSNTGMVLTGGVTASHILFNIAGNYDYTITGGGGNNYYGTVLDPNGNINIHDKNFTGEYIGRNVTITSNPTITKATFVPVPAPLMACGVLLGVVGLVTLRRPRVTVPA